MGEHANPGEGTLPDVDLSPAELLAVAEPGPDTGAARPGWISSILRGEDADGEPVLSLEPGFQVPGTRYQILGWLGDGGMGVVYEAQHVDLDRVVALKVIREKYCRDEELKQMFRAEARAASRVGSEHIVQVYDFTELSDGRLAFAMELLRGRLLKQEINEAPFAPARAIGVLRQACKGLAAAHEAQVVHRDVKPANIVLETSKGRADTVKILDFGIATIMADSVTSHDRGGTPLYVAPELIQGRHASARSDIYSLGCTAYAMLVGHPPFEANSAKEVLLAHLDAPVPEIRAARPDVPEPLAAVVMRCLAKDPEQRHRDMRDLEAALCEAQIASGLETAWDDLALPDVEPERKARLLRDMPHPRRASERRRLTTWLSLSGLLVAAVVFAAWMLRPEPAERTQVETLTIAAQAAAAAAYWVYPPPEDPKYPTAYTRVLDLEALSGDEAASAATALRVEFSDTLTRLGDEYWEREGGKPFAIDYYVQALVFDPEHAVASERARLSPGQLAHLQEKAEEQTFSEDELIAVEPLVALAEDDPGARARKLNEMAQKGHVVAASTGAQLERLVGTQVASLGPGDPADSVEPPPEPADPEPTPSEPEPPDAAVDPDSTLLPVPGTRDAAGARRHAQQGSAALARGDTGAAVDHFEKALAADDRNSTALTGLAQVHFDRGDYATAVRYARKAVRIEPRRAELRIRLGDAYYKAFRFGDAEREYRQALTLGHPDAKSRLAKVEGKSAG